MRKKVKNDIKEPMLVVASSNLISAFFLQMRKDCRYENMTVIDVSAKSLKDLLTQAARLKNMGKYKYVWAVFTTSEFSDASASAIKAYEEKYSPRNINLAYTARSIMLYWALHFQSLTGDEDANMLNDIISKYIPGFKHSVEYLKGAGSSLHLSLFPKKATAALNASSLNQSYRMKNGIDAINFTKLLNSITEHCGEANIAKNQKVVSG